MSVTYTSLQNNRSSDANRKSLLGVNSNIVAEVSRATARETYLRENAAETIASSIDSEMLPNSTNPVQNKVITQELNKKELATRALETVAYSGKYTDLSDRPTIPEEQYIDIMLSNTSTNAVINKTIDAVIKNKAAVSSIKNVAITGSYNDLSDKPIIEEFNRPYVTKNTGTLPIVGTEIRDMWTDRSRTQYNKRRFTFVNNLSVAVSQFYNASNALSVTGIISGSIKISELYTGTITFVPDPFKNRNVVRYNYWQGDCEDEPGSTKVHLIFLFMLEISANRAVKITCEIHDSAWGDTLDSAVIFSGNIGNADKEFFNYAVDLFPTYNANMNLVTSHGTAVRIGQRTNRVKDMDDEKDRANAKISSIYSTIGTLT